MECVPVGARRGLRWGCLGLAAVTAVLAVTSSPADARRARRHSHARLASISSSYDPPYAAIVVDANNGNVLHAANPDAPRHPASLTKIMTLYLLFERLESGKITLDTMMPVSEEAASQAPTKLGVKAGDRLKVDDAIKGLVTKSANDAAVVVAEALGGSVGEFCRMMTRKARALGMSHTTYVNPNGLPDDDQISTARDQALLGIAIQERFPKYYRYFSTPSFVFHGSAMRNHNHLLGQVEGVDGIKTGYTRDSGFNLVTSLRRGPRHLVAVVLGGRSASSRDARMRGLIDEHIAEASTKMPSAAVAMAQRPEAPAAKPQVLAAESFAPANEATAAIVPGSTAPITPVKVKTVTVKLLTSKSVTAPPVATAAPTERFDPTRFAEASVQNRQEEALVASLAAAAPVEAAAPTPPSPPPPIVAPHSGLGRLPAVVSAAKEAIVSSAKAAAKEAVIASAKAEEAPIASAPSRHATARGGWVIQVGAYEDQGEAKQHLNSAKSKVSSLLQKAEAYIERTVKGAKTYYRARFAGFDREQAEAVCKRLKREDITCMTVRI
jgi:D-alanyl-D-alanine carboxypeptidase